MGGKQTHIRFRQGKTDVDGLPSAERALELDANLAEAHVIKAWYLLEQGQPEEANQEIETALGLDSESWEVNRIAGKVLFLQGRLEQAARCYEKATELMDADYGAPGILQSCYRGLGDAQGLKRAARITVARAEKALESNPRDASAISSAAMSLAAIGEKERAREWAERAMALEPDNHILRYNIACAFVMELNDHDRALDLIEDSLMHLGVDHVRDAKADPDLASLRSHPRFAKMIEDAKRRLRISNTGD